MTEFAQRLAQRFATAESRARIVVPQWDGVLPLDSEGEPAIYARMVTHHEAEALRRFGVEPGADFGAEVVLRMAETEAGERLFDRGDKPVLLGAIPERLLLELAGVICANVDHDLSGVPPMPEAGAAGEGDPEPEQEERDRRVARENQRADPKDDRDVAEHDRELESVIHEGDPFG